jgi:hypothetical protein
MLRFTTMLVITFGTLTLDSHPTCLDYRVLRVGCTKNNKCMAVAVVKPKHFNRVDIERLGRGLSERYKEKATITVLLFDDLKIARGFVEGKREWRDHQIDGRGKYFRSSSEEYIQFPPIKAKPFDLVTINLKHS